jgi:hypothetical protein
MRLLSLTILLLGLTALGFADDKGKGDKSEKSDKSEKGEKKISPEDQAKTKKALQDLSEFIGQWNGTCEAKVSGKNTIWKEKIGWSWKFNKEGDSWIAFEVEDAKYYNKGEIRYLLADKKYQFKAKTKDGKDEEVFVGVINKQRLVLERKDEKTNDVHKITMNTAAEGVRFIFAYEVQTGGKGLASMVYKVAANKEGESLAGGGKKNECIVTGGLGTMTVNFNGKTYYVCCTGCRDEFNENPQKYIDAAAKKK